MCVCGLVERYSGHLRKKAWIRSGGTSEAVGKAAAQIQQMFDAFKEAKLPAVATKAKCMYSMLEGSRFAETMGAMYFFSHGIVT